MEYCLGVELSTSGHTIHVRDLDGDVDGDPMVRVGEIVMEGEVVLWGVWRVKGVSDLGLNVGESGEVG